MRPWQSCLMIAAGVGGAADFVRASRRGEEAVGDLLGGLAFGRNAEEVLRRIAERSARLVGGIAAYVERIDFERDEIVVDAVHDGPGLPNKGTRGPYQGSVAQQAIRTNR